MHLLAVTDEDWEVVWFKKKVARYLVMYPQVASLSELAAVIASFALSFSHQAKLSVIKKIIDLSLCNCKL
jgi:hypothetical protein